jgi:glycosyltransferase involved in cell wall biosynthesis
MTAFGPDAMVAHFAGARATVALCETWASGTPLVIKMHAADVFNRTALLRAKSTAAKMLVISDYGARWLREHYADCDWRDLEVHRCGVPLSSQRGRRAQPARAQPAEVTLVSVGRLVPMKGFDIGIRAVAILRGQGRPVRLEIVGSGPEEQRLRREAARLGVGQSVEFLGLQGREGVERALAGARAVVLPCRWDSRRGTQDGIPVALMEAMAGGVPVVSTAVSGIPELVADGVSGKLCAPDDAEDLAKAIGGCLDMAPDEEERMLAQAREAVERRHEAGALARTLLGILRGMTATQASR